MKCKTKEISQNIIDPTTFKSGYVYIITAPITVSSKLTIEDNNTTEQQNFWRKYKDNKRL